MRPLPLSQHTAIGILTLLLVLSSVGSLFLSASSTNKIGTHNNSSHPDIIGWENGYWHNESLSINSSDGLSQAELDKVVSQSMARVEYLRQAEFKRNVTVDVQQANPYNTQIISASSNQSSWQDMVWQALFLSEENTGGESLVQKTQQESVVGYYLPGQDRLVILTEDPKNLSIRGSILVHELTHALQDQRHNLSRPVFDPPTINEEAAVDLLIEGEAMYIQQEYTTRCVSGEWKCISVSSGNDVETDSNPPTGLGLRMLSYYPYSEGPVYIEMILNESGWDGVDEAFENPPKTTQEFEYNTTIDSTASVAPLKLPEGWSQVTSQGKNGSESVGIPGMYVFFWAQSYTYDIDLVAPTDIFSQELRSPYEYYSPLSEGVVEDSLTPVFKEDNEGYIWQIEWESQRDLNEFRLGYSTVLKNHGAQATAHSEYVIKTGGFADHYKILTADDTLYIVNSETKNGLDELVTTLSESHGPFTDP